MEFPEPNATQQIHLMIIISDYYKNCQYQSERYAHFARTSAAAGSDDNAEQWGIKYVREQEKAKYAHTLFTELFPEETFPTEYK